MSYIGPLTNELLNGVVNEIKRKDNKEKISKYVIDPIIYEIGVRITPYLIVGVLIHLIIVGLLIFIAINIPSTSS
jgi:hypothetical protein